MINFFFNIIEHYSLADPVGDAHLVIHRCPLRVSHSMRVSSEKNLQTENYQNFSNLV